MPSLRHIGPSSDPSSGPEQVYLDAARACILDLGWRRTTLTEVARRAGVSRMTIYRRWPDTRTLLGDLMNREWGGVVAARHADQDPVRAIVDTVRALRENDLFVRIVELDPELLLPYLLGRRGRFQDSLLAVVADRVRTGQQDGTIRSGNPDVLARTLVLMCHGFTLSSHTMVDDVASEEAIDAELGEVVARSLRP